MGNLEKDLAEESRKIQKLRDKLRVQLECVEQKVVERALKNKVIKKEESTSKILSKIGNAVAK